MSVWRDLIVGYRKKHGLTQADAATKLRVSQQTISRWESGKQEPDASAQAALRQELGMLALTLKETWIQRVRMSAGREHLFAPGWVCIALSGRLEENEVFMDPSIVGKSLFDVPFFAPLKPVLERTALFSGDTRLARLQVEFHLPTRSVGRTFDLWPVLTGTDEILVHAVAYPFAVPAANPSASGIQVTSVQIVPADAANTQQPANNTRASQ
jgi:transcriptional regulator with XRE-family HTH domain